ncbi:hypothetical protein T08_6031, partial [Trichinella sp. T8]
SRRNKLLRWDHIRSRNSSTPIGPLSLYRPLKESHRPQGVDIDHFGYPWRIVYASRETAKARQVRERPMSTSRSRNYGMPKQYGSERSR